jgi:hypothetical protein
VDRDHGGALPPDALTAAIPFVSAKKSFLLRVDPALWAEVERLAQGDLRSVNAEVEFLLRAALARRGIRPRADGAPSPTIDPKDDADE